MPNPTDEPKAERMEMRTDATFNERVEEWRRRQPRIPSRAEAVRQLVDIGLKQEDGATTAQ